MRERKVEGQMMKGKLARIVFFVAMYVLCHHKIIYQIKTVIVSNEFQL